MSTEEHRRGCPNCNASGVLDGEECPLCKGHCVVTEPHYQPEPEQTPEAPPPVKRKHRKHTGQRCNAPNYRGGKCKRFVAPGKVVCSEHRSGPNPKTGAYRLDGMLRGRERSFYRQAYERLGQSRGLELSIREKLALLDAVHMKFVRTRKDLPELLNAETLNALSHLYKLAASLAGLMLQTKSLELAASENNKSGVTIDLSTNTSQTLVLTTSGERVPMMVAPDGGYLLASGDGTWVNAVCEHDKLGMPLYKPAPTNGSGK